MVESVQLRRAGARKINRELVKLVVYWMAETMASSTRGAAGPTPLALSPSSMQCQLVALCLFARTAPAKQGQAKLGPSRTPPTFHVGREAGSGRSNGEVGALIEGFLSSLVLLSADVWWCCQDTGAAHSPLLPGAAAAAGPA